MSHFLFHRTDRSREDVLTPRQAQLLDDLALTGFGVVYFGQDPVVRGASVSAARAAGSRPLEKHAASATGSRTTD